MQPYIKISLSTFVAFMALWIISPCYSQDRLFDTLWKDLKETEKITKDPIIVVGPEKRYSINTIKIKSQANLIEWESYYLLYRRANKNFLFKYVELLEKFNGKKIYKSQSIEFLNDTIFQWLSLKKENIYKEQILPYIYLDTLLNVPVYKQGFRMHSFPFGLSVHFPTDSSFQNFATFTFDDVALQLTLIPGLIDFPNNLNFEYNRRLNVFKLYTFLNTILTDYSEKFKFP